MRRRLTRLYGHAADRCRDRLASRVAAVQATTLPRRALDETDTLLITYGDMVRTTGEPPLATLGRFLDRHLPDAIGTVHVLPFFPYSSDDGFSVIDYLAVDPELGDWDDVAALGRRFDLMFDLVINHVSRSHAWFDQFLADEPPGREYLLCADPRDDLAAVVRPRTHPVLTPVSTAAGLRHVWTTFSPDQIDLDFRNPDVLLAMAEVALQYVRLGARVLRLDAVAYLFKEVGSSCIHLEETHAVVQILRDLVEAAAPGTLVLTETNVPHRENTSYFGDGDEAHMVYQFSLPPLLLHALTTGRAEVLTRWAAQLDRPPEGCTYLNFTASHDGIGVRPLEGLVPAGEIQALVDHVRAVGGQVSSRSLPDGSEVPYELNVSWFDAIGGAHDEQLHLQCFLCSQTLPLALDGVPALYFHSLTATPNWHEGVEQTGRARTINRRKWDLDDLEAALSRPDGPTATVFGELRRRLRVRRGCPAMAPGQPQQVLSIDPRLFALRRGTGATAMTVVHNLADVPIDVAVDDCVPTSGESNGGAGTWRDIMGECGEVTAGSTLRIPPYGTCWLRPVLEPTQE